MSRQDRGKTGATDDLGLNATGNPVHVRNLHATILHLIGFDHEHFTFKSHRRDHKLTGVAPAHAVFDLLA